VHTITAVSGPGKTSTGPQLITGSDGCLVRVSIPQQKLKFMDGQNPGFFSLVARPPKKFPCGQPFLAQPEALSVIDQNFDGGSPFIAKYKHITGKRVGVQNLFAKPAQPIDPFSEIHRLSGQHYPHMRGHLNHDPRLQNASQSASGSIAPWY